MGYEKKRKRKEKAKAFGKREENGEKKHSHAPKISWRETK